MNRYDFATRGTFQNTEYAKQLVSFEGFRLRGRNGLDNVTPTDIDGFVQLDSVNCFIFFELKHSGDAPPGQKRAMEKACDHIKSGGANCIAIIAEHQTPSDETINARNAIVKEVYWNGKWIKEKDNRKLYEFTRKYVEWLGGNRWEE